MPNELKQALLDGAQQIAVPAFVSTLAICIVFVPMFFLTGVARYLFVPMAEAVVFAMLASYCSRDAGADDGECTCCAGTEHDTAQAPTTLLGRLQARFEKRFEQFRESYRETLATTMRHRRVFVLGSWLSACFPEA